MGARVSITPDGKWEETIFFQMEDIPDEIILKILGYVDVITVLQCAQVNKRINEICMDEALYSYIDFSNKSQLTIHSKMSETLIKMFYYMDDNDNKVIFKNLYFSIFLNSDTRFVFFEKN